MTCIYMSLTLSGSAAYMARHFNLHKVGPEFFSAKDAVCMLLSKAAEYGLA